MMATFRGVADNRQNVGANTDMLIIMIMTR